MGTQSSFLKHAIRNLLGTDHNISTGARAELRLPGLLAIIVLLLAGWQIPLVSLGQRQAGTGAFLAMAFKKTSAPVGVAWPVAVEADAPALERAASRLKQANGTLDTQRTLGVMALAIGDRAGAQEWLLHRLETAPNDPLAHFFLGEAYLRAGDVDAVVEQWATAGAQAQLLGLAEALEEGGAHAEALTALQAVMRLAPTHVEARKRAAEIWRELGQPERALELYQEIIAIAPEEPTGYALSGHVLFDEGQYEQAIVFYRQALERNPAGSRGIWVSLGRAHAALGQWPEAVEAYERTIEADPSYHWSYVMMAEAQCQLGQPDAAYAYYEQAIELGNQKSRVRDALEYIAEHGNCPP